MPMSLRLGGGGTSAQQSRFPFSQDTYRAAQSVLTHWYRILVKILKYLHTSYARLKMFEISYSIVFITGLGSCFEPAHRRPNTAVHVFAALNYGTGHGRLGSDTQAV